MRPFPVEATPTPLPCPECGGKRAHTWECGVARAAREDLFFDQLRWRQDEQREQTERIGALKGKVVAHVGVAASYGFEVTFEGGEVLAGKLTGGEMDGHGESSARSITVRVFTADEWAKKGRW